MAKYTVLANNKGLLVTEIRYILARLGLDQRGCRIDDVTLASIGRCVA